MDGCSRSRVPTRRRALPRARWASAWPRRTRYPRAHAAHSPQVIAHALSFHEGSGAEPSSSMTPRRTARDSPELRGSVQKASALGPPGRIVTMTTSHLNLLAPQVT